MKRSFGKLFFIPLTLLALAFSALGVTTAYADDATPPPATEEPVPPVVVDESAGDADSAEDTTDETEAVVDEVAESDDSAPVDESAGDADSAEDTTEAVVEAAVESDETVAMEESVEESISAESQDCIPQPIDGEIQPEVSESGIPCVPQEPNGENQPESPETSVSESLASAAEAETLFSGDPMWCPAGVLPGGAGCTASFASFTGPTGLIATLEAGATYAGAGTIYVSWDYSRMEWLHFDYGNLALTDLVFQGGWDFTSNTAVGETTFSQVIEIYFYDWGGYGRPGSLTINDINLTKPYGDGFGIYDYDDVTTANVTLNNVSVSNQDISAFIETTGSVTVNNSEFLNNGLGISSPGGTVTINNSRADNSYGDGFGILTDGNVILNNVITNGNSYDGIYIIGYDDDYAGSVSVNGGTFTNNGEGILNNAYGIDVYACQVNLNGAQSFGGNQSGDVYFEQDPACVELNEDKEDKKDKKKPQPTTSTSALCAISELTAGEVKGLLNNLCGITVLMSETLEEDLPAELSDEMTYHLGVKITAIGLPTGGYIELYFPVPEDVDEENLVVLFWNETEWVETLGGEVVDGFFVIKVSEPGVYVLSSK